MLTFAEILFPIPVAGTFTYHIGEDLLSSVKIGCRVIAPFRTSKFYSGIVTSIHNNPPQNFQAKEILQVLDEEPIISEEYLSFYSWISDYYMCTEGEVLKAGLPSGLKLESKSHYTINNDFAYQDELKGKTSLIFDHLSYGGTRSCEELQKELRIKNILPHIKTLLDSGAIISEEEIKAKYKPKTEAFIKLTSKYFSEPSMNSLIESLSRAIKQQKLLLGFISLSGFFENNAYSNVNKKSLLQHTGCSAGILDGLIKKGVFEVISIETSRIISKTSCDLKVNHLNAEQSDSLETTSRLFNGKDVVLLNGVTGSGKTEIYLHLAKKTIDEGKQVLYLLPEITLTSQIISRIKAVFGNIAGIYHSKFSDSWRVETWQKAKSGDIKIVLGTRSSIFIPFSNLGLIIVDEEHETSYKQVDPSPRYHARDAAIYLGRSLGAKVLLGSATPSYESYFNVLNHKYGQALLTKRYSNISMPEIIITDMRAAYKKKTIQAHLTPILYEHIIEALQNKEQVILFQNRRGFSPYIQCNECAYIPQCKKCNVSLTYHKTHNRLDCHYCGSSAPIPTSCPQCGSTDITTKGFGTEKIEAEISSLFPDSRVVRLDIDSASTKTSYEKIISGIENRDYDIIIGTQMVAKGLDFDNVSVVGVLNADNLLHFADFRAFERSFQMLTQVSGRAGRKYKQGKVIIQTTEPRHTVIRSVLLSDFNNLYHAQMDERALFKYPPLFRVIVITIKHKNKGLINKAAITIGRDLRQIFGMRVVGPHSPSIDKIQNLYIKNVMIKVERTKSSAKAKELIKQVIDNMIGNKEFVSLRFAIDVDPI